MSDLSIVVLVIVSVYMFYKFISKPTSKVITTSPSSQISTVPINQPIINTPVIQQKVAPSVPAVPAVPVAPVVPVVPVVQITQQQASNAKQSTPPVVEIPLPVVPPPTPPPPKQLPPPTKNTVYRASPIYYSEKATTGGVQGRLYTTKVSCPAGTKVITDDSGSNGPKLGYYVNPINLGLQPSINIPASCPTTMDKALKPNLRSFGTLSPEGDVAMFSMNMSANIGDPCPSFFKTLELDLSCSIDGVDPGINADIIPYN
jgi:hypothetical protein